MKNNLSFAILAVTVLAGLVLSLVDTGAVRETPHSAGHQVANPIEATPLGAVAIAQAQR